jgi:hypothetical protein
MSRLDVVPRDHLVVELEHYRQGRKRGVVGAHSSALEAGRKVAPAGPAVSIVIDDGADLLA